MKFDIAVLRPALAASLTFVTVVASATAQSTAPLPSILSYSTTKVADGVYAFITPEERSGFQAGNSIAIIGDSGVLVFDTGNLPSSTRRQIAEIRKLTKLPVKYVVNSHWHPDHNLGNYEYRTAFPGVIIIGTEATRDGIRDRLLGYQAQMKGFSTTDSLMKLRLSTGKMRDGSDMTNDTRRFWGILTRDYDEFIPEVMSAKPLPSDIVFTDTLTISLGNRTVQVITPGRANTAGDAYAWIPDSRTLLTGDIITRPCPFPTTAFFREWIKAIDDLKSLNAVNIVPGHGDVEHDYSYVNLVRELLVFTRESALAAARTGQPLDSLQKRIDFTDFIKRFSNGSPIRVDAFNNFYGAAAVARAYDEAKVDVQTPVLPHQ